LVYKKAPIHLKRYFDDMKVNEKSLIETEKQIIADQVARECKLLKEFDPDKKLKEEFKTASLHDLQKYLDEE